MTHPPIKTIRRPVPLASTGVSGLASTVREEIEGTGETYDVVEGVFNRIIWQINIIQTLVDNGLNHMHSLDSEGNTDDRPVENVEKTRGRILDVYSQLDRLTKSVTALTDRVRQL